MRFNSYLVSSYLQPNINKFHLPITTGTALESLYPAGVPQLSPSQALTVNEGYSFSQEDPIRLGILVTRHVDNGKTRPAKPPDVPTILIGVMRISSQAMIG